MAVNLAWLWNVDGFACRRFLAVARWSHLACCVIAGLIEYVFVRDHARGGALVFLTLSLVVFAVHVPALMGFTVARYHRPTPEPELQQLTAASSRRGIGTIGPARTIAARIAAVSARSSAG